ncbi:MAG TPA: recombinase family protein [Candidatus Paceibacterota bacterium]
MNHDYQFFIYCRKSSEDSHRQIASINDQIDSLQKIVKRENLKIVDEIYIEERSAKDPGRPIFNEMIQKIQKGKANALFCWDIDRLSRNPIDNGQLQWMLQKGVIKVIKTPNRSYYPEDAGLLMSIEGGRATDYVLRLAKNIKRGLDSRAIKGWKPCLAPIGYINVGSEKGNKTIIPDPQRFGIIRKMWDMLLTGSYSMNTIQKIAAEDFGLRTRRGRKIGGKVISRTHLYEIFGDTFYYGYYYWKDSDSDENKLVKGNHEPMITEQEFWHAQTILGRKGKPQPKFREFSYTGLMRCGECDSCITAEEKHQVICSNCKCKFSNITQTHCPKCSTDIMDMVNPKILHYIYYHCTKKKNQKCVQKSIKLEELEQQIIAILDKVIIDERIIALFKDYSRITLEKNVDEENIIKSSLQIALENCLKRLSNLKREYVSEFNTNHELYTQAEYIEQKQNILTEKENLEQKIRQTEGSIENSLKMTEKFFRLCYYAKSHFLNGDKKVRRTIFGILGSNLKLIDKKLDLKRIYPYLMIEDTKKKELANLATLEQENNLMVNEPNVVYGLNIPLWWRWRESNPRA